MRVRRTFASPFVITLAACRSAEPPPSPPAADETWEIHKAEGRCDVRLHVECPPSGTCNPPEPMPIVCPAGPATTIERRGQKCTVGKLPIECPDFNTAKPPPKIPWRIVREGETCSGQAHCSRDMASCTSQVMAFACPMIEKRHVLGDHEVLFAIESSSYCSEDIPETPARKARWFKCPPLE